MFEFTGYKGVVYEADFGWNISDTNGRTGKLTQVFAEPIGAERVLVVSTNYGTTIQIDEKDVSFVSPPEEV